MGNSLCALASIDLSQSVIGSIFVVKDPCVAHDDAFVNSAHSQNGVEDGRFFEACAESERFPEPRSEGRLELDTGAPTEPVKETALLWTCTNGSLGPEEPGGKGITNIGRVEGRASSAPDAVPFADTATTMASLADWSLLVAF